MARIYAPTSREITRREEQNMQRVRRIAAEGMVLLENKGVLPLKAEARALALFGNGVRKMVKGGTGSGDVNSRTVINVEQGLEEAGFTIATKNWLDRFDQACTDHGAEYMAEFQAVLQEKGFAGVNFALENPYLFVPVWTWTWSALSMHGISKNWWNRARSRCSGSMKASGVY